MSRANRAWNHSTQHHRALLRLVPARSAAALDIGSGDGSFAALLAQRCETVVAIDLDPAQVRATKLRCSTLPNVRVEQADLLACDLGGEQFDVVTALASLHHLPFDAAAAKIHQLLRPGGRLVVLGVWTDRRTTWGVTLDLLSSALHVGLRCLRGPDVMTAPARMPSMTFPEVQQAARRAFPGARLRRRALWRYTLVWDKPIAR